MCFRPWVSFCLTVLPDRRLSFLREGSCSCPGAREHPDYCKERGESLHLPDQDKFLSLHQTRVPLLDLLAEAVGLEEEEDQKGTGNGGVMEGHRQFVPQNL